MTAEGFIKLTLDLSKTYGLGKDGSDPFVAGINGSLPPLFERRNFPTF